MAIQPAITRDHSERLFNGFGVPVETSKTDDGKNSQFN